jgi:GntR family transcriptional regulator
MTALDAQIEGIAALLSRSSPEPLHDQISSLLRQRIVSGRWPSHMRLPSEPEMATMLGVARGTIRRATRTLLAEGLLVQHQGRGTFVASQMLEQSFAQEIVSTSEALDRDGVRYDTRVVRRSVEVAPQAVAAHLHLRDAEAQVAAIRRVRSVEGVPVFILDNYVVASLCPGLESADLSSRALFAVLEQDYDLRVSGVQRTFQAQAASAEIAALLGLAIGDPVLYLEQISYEQDGEPIEYSDVWIRGDKLRVSSWLAR